MSIMNRFKEWLSDNLRYLMLLAALLLASGVVVLGVRMYQTYQAQKTQDAPDIEIITTESVSDSVPERETEVLTEALTEAHTEAVTEAAAERVTESESETESETVSSGAAGYSGKLVPVGESESESETEKDYTIVNLQIETNAPRKETEKKETEAGSLNGQNQTGSLTETQPATEAPVPETQPQTEEIDTLVGYTNSQTRYAVTSLNVRSGPGTEYEVIADVGQGGELYVTGETSSWYRVNYGGQIGFVGKNLVEEQYTPVYKTMTGTCYMRSEPDYGDNIIGEYSAGTTVEFLEDVGGWYKVRVDGMTGYMGARFF